jgi:hypothetical protein
MQYFYVSLFFTKYVHIEIFSKSEAKLYQASREAHAEIQTKLDGIRSTAILMETEFQIAPDLQNIEKEKIAGLSTKQIERLTGLSRGTILKT